jgi:hypothetical protein
MLLTIRAALVRRLAPDRPLNPVSRADAFERFGIQRVGTRNVQFIELSSSVSPASRLHDPPGFRFAVSRSKHWNRRIVGMHFRRRHHVTTHVYLALAILLDGTRDILGLWIENTECAKFWMKVFNDLKTRGVGDIHISMTDGFKGMPEALAVVFPTTTLQTCIVP